MLGLVGAGSTIYHSKTADYWENKAILYESHIQTRDGIISSLSSDLVLLNDIAKEREKRGKEQERLYADLERKYEELRQSSQDVDDWWLTPIPDELREIWYSNKPR